MRSLSSSPDSSSSVVSLILRENVNTVRKAVLKDLFGPGVQDIKQATTLPLLLPTSPIKELAPKKLESLGNKYFSIPDQYISYYPEVRGPAQAQETEDATTTHVSTERRVDKGKRRRATNAPTTGSSSQGKRKPGRPKKAPAVTATEGQKSILSFFETNPSQRQ
jgi:hypothetical protein